jgi:hypothetical protein
MLGFLFEPLSEQTVIKVRAMEIIKFLKRLFTMDIKKTVSQQILLSARVFLVSLKTLLHILKDNRFKNQFGIEVFVSSS